ncbi:SDR family oxidoreductase [Pseudomonas cichorii]|uniref:SDR family NAD(P)-dependent oxidoreductase n=1 Tax=Pseudomonas cichorii TaxID=36746 RepID=UPI0018E5BDC4|nr:SDR family oxidoreductase [Pseudomonas cichorii]MBI6855157.1 SDR family oxidoreductase [Pseudomonas cichorii]
MNNDPFSLIGKSVMVTGASSGIGREVAIWLSRQGARVTLVARSVERLQETLNQLEGDHHCVEPFDFLSGQDVSAWMKSQVKASTIPFDGLVHAAGVLMPMPIRALGMDQWEKIFATNVTSGFSLIKAFRQKGVCNKGSSIVLVSSVMGRVAEPALTGYCASKGAVDSMVRAAALELAREDIRVNSVAPGVVDSEMTQSLDVLVGENAMREIAQKHVLGIGKALDVAYAVNYLLSPAARWVTGTSLVVDGGYLAQ